MQQQLIVFGEDWAQHPSSTQHLIKQLLGPWQVLWVNSIGLRSPRLSVHDLKRLSNKLAAAFKPRAKPALKHDDDTGATPMLHHPLTLPLLGNACARQINRLGLGRSLKRRCQQAGFKRPILWTSLPSAVDYLDCTDERAVVYYCGDDFSALAGVDHRVVEKMEQRLVERADLILAASPLLAERFPAHKTRLLEHGVDGELFTQTAAKSAEFDSRPTAGFYGSIAAWLDLPLLAAVARLRPQWRFILIGEPSPDCDLSPLHNIENIELLGPRAHSELPSYSQHWQAALLPFKDNAQIRACNPLKLREYLCAGQPIVTTDFPALDDYRHLLSCVNSAEEMAEALDASLALDDGAQQSLRKNMRESVAAQSWKHRAQQLQSYLNEL